MRRPDRLGQQRGAEAAVEGAHARAGLAEAGVVGGDREVADEVQDLPAADRVAGDHGDDRLRQAAHLHVQVGDVEAADLRALGHVARVAAHALVAAGAEGQLALAGEDDRADVRVLARELERLRDLHDRLRAEGVADLGAVDRDLRDPVPAGLVADVLEVRRRLSTWRPITLVGCRSTPGCRAPRRSAPTRVALEAPEGALTYAQLLEAARIDAAPGGRVALALPPGLEFAVALHACLLRARGGDAGRPAAGGGRAGRAAGVAPTLVVDAPLPRGGAAPPAGRAARRRHRARRAHLAARPAAPRPVELSFGNVQANALGSAVALGLDPDERWLCPLPLSHVGGLMVLLRSAIYGDPRRARRAPSGRACADDVTVVSLVPTQLRRLLDAGARPGARLRVRAARRRGGARPTCSRRRARPAGPSAPPTASPQACSQVAVDGAAAARPARVALAGATARSSSRARRSPAAASCARATSAASTTAAGWTSSAASADTIVTGGENVAPAEVEAALLAHPAVADAGVFGRPDPEWGEAVDGAASCCAPARRPAGAARVGRRRGSRATRCPRRSRWREALPRNASGKLLRRELR